MAARTSTGGSRSPSFLLRSPSVSARSRLVRLASRVGGREDVRVRDDDLAAHLPRLGAGGLDDGVAAARVQRRAVRAEA